MGASRPHLNLITFQGPHLLMPSHCELELTTQKVKIQLKGMYFQLFLQVAIYMLRATFFMFWNTYITLAAP